jgi:hypothetical protein
MKARPSLVRILALALATSAAAQTPVSLDGQGSSGKNPHDIGPLASYKIPAQPAEGLAASGYREDIRTMPTYRVTDIHVTLFRDRDIYTRIGMAALAFRRHPGLLIGNPFRLNESLAYQTFLRDDWNNTKDEYRNIAHAMALGGDADEGRMIVKEVDDEDARMRADEEGPASAPSMGRFAISSAETGTKLLELPEQTIDVPFVRKTW